MRLYVGLLLFAAVFAGLLFGSAGRVDLPALWVYWAIMCTVSVIGARTIDPGLIRERIRPGPGGQDRYLRLIALPFGVAHWVSAGLDVGRFHFSDAVPLGMQAVGLVGVALAFAGAAWAMTVNRFYSPVIRIQSERGHHLVTAGPYRYVRHPGYAAILLLCVFSPVALGSWLSMVPMGGVLLLILRRTILEDRYLRQRLEGYDEYTQRVRYRLAPGVW